MKKFNIWRSTFTNHLYAFTVDFIPQFKGWELVDTIQAKNQLEATNIAILKELEG